MAKIITAESSGFCFGVQRAVSICEKAAEEYTGCVTLGPIIHNGSVVRELYRKGVRAVRDITEIRPGMTVIVRSHGAGKEEYEYLTRLGVNIIDATCPNVKKIHDIVREEIRSGRIPVIIGEKRHPEVMAISSWCGDCKVFETVDELSLWLKSDSNAQKLISVVFQTTNTKNVFNACIYIIKKECTNYKIFDTICSATRIRQQEAAELSKHSDIMIVVGDVYSANSLRLVDICKENCSRVVFIKGADDLTAVDIQPSDIIGIISGASTPACIIKEVTQKMNEDNVLDETCIEQEPKEQGSQETIEEDSAVTDLNADPLNGAPETTENDGQCDAAEPVIMADQTDTEDINETPVESVMEENHESPRDETPEPDTAEHAAAVFDEQTEPDDEDALADGASAAVESFEEMLEKSIKTLHTGQKVTGVITSITATEVSVDLGTKQSGYIPISEFTDDANTQIEDIIKIGDSIETFVMRVNDVEGMVMLSKRRLDAIKNWDVIESAKESKAIVEGVVTEENKGGVVVNVKGVRVFIPASQTGLPKSSPMSELIKKTVRLRITEVNQSRRRVVGSIRAVQADERREKSDRLWTDIEVGKQYSGVVKSMTSYGVFVDIGGVDGMIHISELSWTRIKQPSEVMAVGDEVSVYVLSFDKETRKISLGYKKNEDNPWTKFTSNNAVGDIVNVKIVKLMPFGAFAEINAGVDGLIHISQITDHRIGLPSEVLSDGQFVDVKITEIDNERKKVSLSIRALIEPSSQPLTDAEINQAAQIDKTPVVVYDTDSPPPEDPEEDAAPEPEPYQTELIQNASDIVPEAEGQKLNEEETVGDALTEISAPETTPDDVQAAEIKSTEVPPEID